MCILRPQTQVKVRDNVEREKLQVVSELANIQEQNKVVLLNLKKEEEVVAKIRIEVSGRRPVKLKRQKPLSILWP
jgi:hypothetical protein